MFQQTIQIVFILLIEINEVDFNQKSSPLPSPALINL